MCGVAVNFHGYSRPTGDLDIWLDPRDENKSRLLDALYEMKNFEEDIQIVKNAIFLNQLFFTLEQSLLLWLILLQKLLALIGMRLGK